MSLSLKLELHPNNKVLVTNSINQETKEVTFNFIRDITRNSLDCLIQYKFYEILINAQGVWNQVKNFDCQTDAAREIEIEKKFVNIMATGSWIEISDYEREMYNRALPVIRIYDHERGVAKTTRVIHKLEKFDWRVIEKNKDHIIMVNYAKQTTLFIPNNYEIEKKTLQSLINKAGLSIREFLFVS